MVQNETTFEGVPQSYTVTKGEIRINIVVLDADQFAAGSVMKLVKAGQPIKMTMSGLQGELNMDPPAPPALGPMGPGNAEPVDPSPSPTPPSTGDDKSSSADPNTKTGSTKNGAGRKPRGEKTNPDPSPDPKKAAA